MTGSEPRFALLGPGRVGSSISLALHQKGWICASIMYSRASRTELAKLRMIFPKSQLVRSRALQLSANGNNINRSHPMTDVVSRKRSTFEFDGRQPQVALRDFDLLLIAVEDDKLQSVAAWLSALRSLNWKGKVVLHTSGVVRVNVLSALKSRGAAVGGLHPIAAFASRYDAEAARGKYFDFFGDRAAEVAARRITRSLRSKLLIMNSEKERGLLHAACANASNSTVVAVRSAERLISTFIDSKNATGLIESLLSSTVENLREKRRMDSLTGPLKRGDVGVVAEHMKILQSDVDVLRFYRSWSLLGTKMLLEVERDKFQRARLKEIWKLLEGK